MLDYAIEDEQRCTYGSAYTDLEKKALELRASLSQTYGESVLIISREFSSAFERFDNNAARGDDRTLNDRLLHLVEACDRGAAELRAAALSDLEV
ncbi:hypothetical protein ABE438_09360 [Bosea sp. TWI1241]|uniref:hypothetical protein n=1 Tax=Bosea sp. TWI1241 TaxID=3148904 RepID=UPI0032097DAD